MSDPIDVLQRRVRYLPGQIEATQRKLSALIKEARRYGMRELANSAWDSVILEAQAEALARGDSIGFGDSKGD